MAMRALSGLCILFLLLSASHVLPSTEAARILEENKAAGDGLSYGSVNNPNKPARTARPGGSYTHRGRSCTYKHCTPPETNP